MSKKKDLKIIYNDNLPIVLADNIIINIRKDRLCYLKFFMALPEGVKEQAKLFIAEKDLKYMLDQISNRLNYFPEKKKTIKKVPK